MAARRLVGILVILIVTASILAVYFLYVNPPWPVDATIAAVLADPTWYNDREVRLQGYLRKTWFQTWLIHNLTDGAAGLPVTASVSDGAPSLDLDGYVGLKLLVEGRVRYRPQVLGSPNLLIEAKTVQVKEGSPRFFLQLERSGGLAGLRQTFMIDHASTASLLSRAEKVWERTLTSDELQEATRIITANGFFTLPADRYEARASAADYFTHSLKVVLVSDSKVSSRTVAWVDEWASRDPLPSNLTRLQADLEAYVATLLPPRYGGASLTVSVDKPNVTVGEYVTVALRVTNVAAANQTFTVSLPVFDLLLFDENGTLWARWSEGQAFPEVIFLKTLTPGEGYEEELLWNLYRYDSATYSFKSLSPGTYYLQGVFRSLPELQTARILIKVAPKAQG